MFPEEGFRMDTTPHDSSFVRATRLCPDTATFAFTRSQGYRFMAGQYLSLTVDTHEGPQTHLFSHCNSPADEEYLILTRLTGSAFKDALLALEPGGRVTIAGPQGLLTVGEGVKRAAFLVGGVGVSPARSIVRDAAQRDSGLEALVFDGNHDESCIPLRDEFDGYARSHPGLRFVHVLEKPSDVWEGERGFITADLVRRHCDPFDDWHWYVAGPPAMVTAMRVVLDDLGIPESGISFEAFAGYK